MLMFTISNTIGVAEGLYPRMPLWRIDTAIWQRAEEAEETDQKYRSHSVN